MILIDLKITYKHIVFLSALLFGFVSSAQDYNTKIEGRVFSNGNDVAATHVSNITSNRGTITDENGFFSITVKLNDTLVFSAVQFKKKEVIVTIETLENNKLEVSLEDALTELDGVVLMPYNLSGELNRDLDGLKTGQIITASTEQLPNANIKKATQAERKLYGARTWDPQFYLLSFKVKLDPIWNYFSGRTKMLNNRVAQDEQTVLTNKFRKYYADSRYILDLKIPKKNIDDFVFFCEIDSSFAASIRDDDKLELWEFMKKKSLIYRKNNNLD